jgi:hypothetical protein
MNKVEQKEYKRLKMLKDKFGIRSDEEMRSLSMFGFLKKEINKNCIICSLSRWYLVAPRKTRFLVFYMGILCQFLVAAFFFESDSGSSET